MMVTVFEINFVINNCKFQLNNCVLLKENIYCIRLLVILKCKCALVKRADVRGINVPSRDRILTESWCATGRQVGELYNLDICEVLELSTRSLCSFSSVRDKQVVLILYFYMFK